MSNGKLRCTCQRCTVSGLMGPVVLITLGALFLLDKFVSGVSFKQLWPALLIVIGLVKLAEAFSSHEGHQGT
jgi:uncharacterized membrane protein HdeD (DUF308 family)